MRSERAEIHVSHAIPSQSKQASRPSRRPNLQPSVVVVGSVALDVIHTATTTTDLVLGGSAVHFSNAASFFTTVGIVGVVGEDYPQEELGFLRRRRVDLSGLQAESGESFLWEGRYSPDFRQRETLRTRVGVFAGFNPVLPQHFRKPRTLFLAAIDPRLQLRVLEQVQRPKLVAMDTFKLWIDTDRGTLLRVLKKCDLFFVNDDEVRWLTGEDNLLKGAVVLSRMGPRWIVVKKGEHGSFLYSKRGLYLSNTYPVPEVVDPTGAGDAYAGGMLGYVTRMRRVDEAALRRAMSWASVLGSFYVEGFGPAGLRHRKWSELQRRHVKFMRMCGLK